MVARTSLRKIEISRGASMPIFTISPSIRVMRISMESPITIASLTLRERTSIEDSGCAGGGRPRMFDEGVMCDVARVVRNNELAADPRTAVHHERANEIGGGFDRLLALEGDDVEN